MTRETTPKPLMLLRKAHETLRGLLAELDEAGIGQKAGLHIQWAIDLLAEEMRTLSH